MDSVAESRWVRAELVPRREADGSVVWSGYWVDASAERARSDELARARDLAEAASRAKDDFLAMMSHEIRTPMNGVLGLVEVLERTRLDADQGEMLRMIHESAGALLQILDDLLDYSKIEAGRLTIEAEPLDLRDLVDNGGRVAGWTRARERAEGARRHRAASGGGGARRQRAPAADPVQPAGQRDQVHAGRAKWMCRSRSSQHTGPARRSKSPSKIPASALRRKRRRVCSSRSCRRNRRPRAASAAPASG